MLPRRRAPFSSLVIRQLSKRTERRGSSLASIYFATAEQLRVEAASDDNLDAALQCYRKVLQFAPRSKVGLRARARERLLLMLLQRANVREKSHADEIAVNEIRRHMKLGGFVCHLSSAVLCYGNTRNATQFLPPPPATAQALDGVLPADMLAALQRAFSPNSPFWHEHGYECGKSPFFSYIHALDQPPRIGFDYVLAKLLHHACEHFPRARAARFAEWWAHCRPHGIGHQLHFDSDDEGEGGIRNPLVSSALYLTSGVGGPTLVTEQKAGQALAQRGWSVMPEENRYLLFDGKLLHGVVPGCGAVGREGGSSGRRRITLMVAFWQTIETRPSAVPSSARPFPYDYTADAKSLGSCDAAVAASWAPLFDWPTSRPESEAPVRAVESPLYPVQPVWELTPASRHNGCSHDDSLSKTGQSLPNIRDRDHGASWLYSARTMPSYEQCFQGLC